MTTPNEVVAACAVLLVPVVALALRGGAKDRAKEREEVPMAPPAVTPPLKRYHGEAYLARTPLLAAAKGVERAQ